MLDLTIVIHIVYLRIVPKVVKEWILKVCYCFFQGNFKHRSIFQLYVLVCTCSSAVLHVTAPALMTSNVGEYTSARHVPQIRLINKVSERRQQDNIDKCFSRHLLGREVEKTKEKTYVFLLNRQYVPSVMRKLTSGFSLSSGHGKRTPTPPGRFTDSPIHYMDTGWGPTTFFRLLVFYQPDRFWVVIPSTGPTFTAM